MAWNGWIPNHLDPAAMLDVLLESGTVIPTFEDATWRARLAAAAQITGAERYLPLAGCAPEIGRDWRRPDSWWR
jgi:hypothetical protein